MGHLAAHIRAAAFGAKFSSGLCLCWILAAFAREHGTLFFVGWCHSYFRMSLVARFSSETDCEKCGHTAEIKTRLSAPLRFEGQAGTSDNEWAVIVSCFIFT